MSHWYNNVDPLTLFAPYRTTFVSTVLPITSLSSPTSLTLFLAPSPRKPSWNDVIKSGNTSDIQPSLATPSELGVPLISSFRKYHPMSLRPWVDGLQMPSYATGAPSNRLHHSTPAISTLPTHFYLKILTPNDLHRHLGVSSPLTRRLGGFTIG